MKRGHAGREQGDDEGAGAPSAAPRRRQRQKPRISDDSPPPSGERPSFNALFPFARRFVYNIVVRLGVPPSEREDLTQKILVSVYESLPSYDPRLDIRPWLKTIAVRAIRDYRDLARHRHEDLQAEPMGGVGDTAEEGIVLRDLVAGVLSTIPFERRVVLVLHKVEGMTMAEVAKALEIPVSTANSRYRLAVADFEEAWARRRKQDAHRGLAPLPVVDMGSLFDSNQPLLEVPSAVRVRLRSKVMRAVRAAEAAARAGAGAATKAGAGAAMTIAPMKAAAAGVLVFALGAGVGAGAHALWRPSPPVLPASTAPAALPDTASLPGLVSPPAPSTEAPSAPESAAPSRPTATPRESRPPPRPPADPAPTTPPAPSQVASTAPSASASAPARAPGAAELEKRPIDLAQAAMLRGDYASAIKHLEGHARDFPGGFHAQERDKLLALARAKAAEHQR